MVNGCLEICDRMKKNERWLRLFRVAWFTHCEAGVAEAAERVYEEVD